MPPNIDGRINTAKWLPQQRDERKKKNNTLDFSITYSKYLPITRKDGNITRINTTTNVSKYIVNVE